MDKKKLIYFIVSFVSCIVCTVSLTLGALRSSAREESSFLIDSLKYISLIFFIIFGVLFLLRLFNKK